MNARKRSLGACRSLSDQFSAQTLFDVFAKFHFQQLPKVTLTHIPLQAPLGPQFFFAATLHWWLHLVAQVHLKVRAVTYDVIYYI